VNTQQHDDHDASGNDAGNSTPGGGTGDGHDASGTSGMQRSDTAPQHRMDASTMPIACEARNEFEAQCVQSVLEDAGIQSVIDPSGVAIFGFPLRAGSTVVPVRVLPEDLSRAKQMISEARWVGKSVDWDDVDVGEMPPDVIRMLSRARTDRVIGRVMMAVAWIAIATVLASITIGLVRSIAGR
jgi:hypothetical protein